MAFKNSLNLERVEIQIDPDSLEYRMDIHLCSMERLYWVISDIKKKLENQDLGSTVTVTNEETGKELTQDERADYFSKLREDNSGKN